MAKPLHHDQDARLPKPAAHRRRRRRHTKRRGAVGPQRPGRFFRPRLKLRAARLALKPFHLGEVDWLLYRREFNPYRRRTWNAKNYARGFAACKLDMPKPAWDPRP